VRVLRRVLIGAAVVALLCVLGARAWVRGAWVEARPPAELDALLASHDEVFRPEGAGPFPALVMFHGCGGLRESLRQWADQMRDLGVLVVATDSHAGRGLAWEKVCSGRALLGAERAGDAWVALARVRARPDVDPARVALAGWSHGAWTLMELFALEDGELPPNLEEAPATELADVAGLVLLYPYCGLGARALFHWPRAVPTLMLLAEQDRIVDADACARWGEARAADGKPVTTHAYAGVDHGFDQAVPSGEWEPTYDAAAAEDARRRVAVFLAERLALGPGRPTASSAR